MAERKPRPQKTSGNPLLKDVPKKIANALKEDDEWLEKIQQFSKEDLDKEIVKSNELLVDYKKDMDEDPDLNALKEKLKEDSAVYKEGIAINSARGAYCVLLKRSM